MYSNKLCVGLWIVLVLAAEVSLSAAASDLQSGSWRAWLDSPGGALPFGMELVRGHPGWRAWLINGQERIEIPQVSSNGSELILDIDYYDSVIRASISADGKRLDGQWKKRRGPNQWSKLAFHATAGKAPRFKPLQNSTPDVPGGKLALRWSVHFSSDDSPAVGVFKRRPDATIAGTFLTTTGDYRYLAGTFERGRLRLSCFDGAHAFLFDARMQPDGTLAGDFWSRDSWHETWTARPDPNAALADPFAQTTWTGTVPLSNLSFPDPEGHRRSLDDPLFSGKARIIELFGTWCPNCHDASEYLVELDRRYRRRGLSIVALAFELTGDFSRDARQVRRYAKRLGISYPILIAGVSDKQKASQAFSALDQIRAFPTTVFLHADGRVRAVHSGYAGPATGQAHRALRAKFESLIEELLAESDRRPAKSDSD